MIGLEADAARRERVAVQTLDDVADDVPLAALVATVERAMRALPIHEDARFSLVLTGDERLHELNRRYRGIDAPTDVLSFRTDDDAGGPIDGEDGPYLGDVIISVAYATRSAAHQGRGRDDELALLAVHGLLHLIGHDDADDAGAATMRKIERALGVRAD